jgi:hypothetical protein
MGPRPVIAPDRQQQSAPSTEEIEERTGRSKPGPSIYPDASIEFAASSTRQKCLVNVICGLLIADEVVCDSAAVGVKTKEVLAVD